MTAAAHDHAQLQSFRRGRVVDHASRRALPLSDYSLIPLNGPGTGNGSAIGFTSTPFTYPPTAPTSSFKIVSPANTLQIIGQGFSPGMTTELLRPGDALAHLQDRRFLRRICAAADALDRRGQRRVQGRLVGQPQ